MTGKDDDYDDVIVSDDLGSSSDNDNDRTEDGAAVTDDIIDLVASDVEFEIRV